MPAMGGKRTFHVRLSSGASARKAAGFANQELNEPRPLFRDSKGHPNCPRQLLLARMPHAITWSSCAPAAEVSSSAKRLSVRKSCFVSSDAGPSSRLGGVLSAAIEPLPQTLRKLRGARWRHPDRVPFGPALGPL